MALEEPLQFLQMNVLLYKYMATRVAYEFMFIGKRRPNFRH